MGTTRFAAAPYLAVGTGQDEHALGPCRPTFTLALAGAYVSKFLRTKDREQVRAEDKG